MLGLFGFAEDFADMNSHASTYAGLFQQQGSGTVVLADATNELAFEQNGAMQMRCNAGLEFQLRTVGLPFQFRYGKKLWLGGRISLKDFDATNFFVGLSAVSNEIVVTIPANMAGFYSTNEDGTIDAICRASATSTQTELVDHAFTADDQWRELAIEWDGNGRLTYYIAGKLVQLHMTNIPTNTPLRFVIEIESDTLEDMWVDYLYCWQER